MKHFVAILGSGLIGLITTALGWGWFHPEGGISAKGAILNSIAVVTWVCLVHLIADRKKAE